MAHPVGTHINRDQDHELEYWLRKWKFAQSKANKDILCGMIDDAKKANGLDSNKHLEHETLDAFYSDNKSEYKFTITKSS